MFTERDLFNIIKYTKSPAAQHLALKSLDRKALWALATNENLTPEIWKKLYDQLRSQEFNDYRRALLCSAPTEALALKVLEESDAELFDDVLSAGITNLSPSLAREIVTSKLFSVASLAAMVGSGQESEQLARELLTKVVTNSLNPALNNPWPVVASLATNYPGLTDQEITSLCELYYKSADHLALAIDLRPSLIPLLTTSTKALYFYPTVAHSRHLTDELAQNILSDLASRQPQELLISEKPYLKALEGIYKNPNVTFQLRQHALNLIAAASGTTPHNWRPANEEELPYVDLLNRQNAYPTTTPWDQVDEIDLPRVIAAVEILGDWRYPSLKYKAYWRQATRVAEYEQDQATINDLIDPALDKLGEQGWFIFFSTLPSWQESLDNLLSVVLNLVAKDATTTATETGVS